MYNNILIKCLHPTEIIMLSTLYQLKLRYWLVGGWGGVCVKHMVDDYIIGEGGK